MYMHHLIRNIVSSNNTHMARQLHTKESQIKGKEKLTSQIYIAFYLGRINAICVIS